jgi:hypothetical protein
MHIMSRVEALSGYLDRCVRRLRRYAWVRGAAIFSVTALFLTVTLAWIMSRVPGSPAALLAERVMLGAGVIGALWIACRRLNRTAVVNRLEITFPAFSQRLTTFIDREQLYPADPFLPLLADEALTIAAAASPRQFVPPRSFVYASLAAMMSVSLLVFLILTASNAGVLWGIREAFRIEVKASHKTVRRGGEVTVTAQVSGFSAHNASLWMRTAAHSWQSVPMLPASEEHTFALWIASVPQNTEYYVEAGGVRSPHSRVGVVDLPAVTGVRVSYPNGPLSARAVNGDIIAPAGAIPNLEILSDRPLTDAQLIFEKADPIPIAPGAETHFRVLRNDGYHVSVRYAGEDIAVSREYAVEVLTGEAHAPPQPALLQGSRIGPMPPGYEKSVSEYYRRLSEQQTARP